MKNLSYREHYIKTILLALPVCLSNMGYMLVGIVDAKMVGMIEPGQFGYTGTEAQAAVALANSFYAIVLVMGIGISYGITPLVAAADASGDNVTKARVLKNGFYINLISNFLLFGVLFFISPVLALFGQEAKVVELAIPFMNVMIFGMVPLSIFFTFKQFAEGLSLTVVTMIATLIGNGLNILLNWVLIFGHWGFEPMGLQGSCWASFVARIFMALMLFAYIRWNERFRVYWEEMKKIKLNWGISKKIIDLGFATGLQWVFEVAAFTLAVIWMGQLGKDEQAAHLIAISVAAFTYMFASGFSAGTSIRVGNYFGLKDIAQVRRAAFAGLHVTIACMAVFALCFLVLSGFLADSFSRDARVVDIAASLIVIAAFFQVFDGMQVLALGALRGIEDTKIPTTITLISYWGLGIPCCYLLGFTFHLGAQGIWWGLSIGLFAAAVLLLLRFNYVSERINFKQPKEGLLDDPDFFNNPA